MVDLALLLDNSAHSRPGKIAFTAKALSVSYENFHRDVEALASQLFRHGIRPGDVVGVYILGAAAHWALLIALMRIGAVSVSLTTRYREEIQALPELSAVLCPPGFVMADSRSIRLVEISGDWLSGSVTIELPDAKAAAETLGRICFSSGTSGAPKPMLLDASTLTHRVSGTAARSRIASDTVLWCGLGPDTAYGFTASLATWNAGGQILFATKHEEVIQFGANLIIASPAGLNSLLSGDHSGAERPTIGRISGSLIVAGGRLSTKLRDRVRSELCSEVLVAYGSSEAGGITLGAASELDHHPGRVGYVFSDVQVEIVDSDDDALPPNTPGQIRIRTKNAASSYLDDPIATASHFRDGWFYPGDLATLSTSRLLTLIGKATDVLNLGGQKVSSQDIDTAVCKQPGVEDACAVSLPTAIGKVYLLIAVVAPKENIKGLLSLIRQELPLLPAFSIVPVSAIPRNSMGKVNRESFARALAERLRNPTSVQTSDGFVILNEA